MISRDAGKSSARERFHKKIRKGNENLVTILKAIAFIIRFEINKIEESIGYRSVSICFYNLGYFIHHVTKSLNVQKSRQPISNQSIIFHFFPLAVCKDLSPKPAVVITSA